ncbi:hypothetical protein Q9R23_13815 [Exiguobacterium sp. BRG2]|uniref:hypothetical protein n=1 Tax=unclassified Exiguobacterium TaxID=2644629 RepID=UPI000ED05B88|nr:MULTISPECIES: hypothetical protein [unclassified Exiguobacterium]MDT0174049.1 hypothetical protein [Exiguobacterium sp. BRG2]HCV52250.1 hypothetical protein [Exiguobacterium sp.]
MFRQKSLLYLLIFLSFGLAFDTITGSSLVPFVEPLHLLMTSLALTITTACLTLFFLLYHGVRMHLELLIVLPFLILTSGITFFFVFLSAMTVI